MEPIKNALEWSKVEDELRMRVKLVKDQKLVSQATKMLNNFEAMVTKLSVLEMEARRSNSGSKRKVNEQLKLINSEAIQFDYWLVMLMIS
jgi:hypothetical protein